MSRFFDINELRDSDTMNGNYEEVHDSNYERAYKRMKQIKGFYVHLMVYILVNFVLLILDFSHGDKFEWEDALTPGFWGLGLVAHASVVFLPDFFFGEKWEENKINEILNKDRKHYS